MKKILYVLTGIFTFINLSIVKADTYNASSFYDTLDQNIEVYNQYSENINYMINWFNNNISSTYSDYVIIYENIQSGYNTGSIHLYYGNDLFVDIPSSGYQYADISNAEHTGSSMADQDYYGITYDIPNDSYFVSPGVRYEFTPSLLNNILFSNNLKFKENEYFDKIIIPSYSYENISIPSYEISDGDLFPIYINLYNGTYQPNELANYREINLNSYPYIALSLKNCNRQDSFDSIIYVKGQLCINPVYNYGMNERDNITDRCSVVYDNFTPVRFSVLSQDLQNHSIYYVKAYDTSIDNIIRVDTSIFDITYFNNENFNNPVVNVCGNSYSTIPWDDLSNTVIDNENNNYIPGASQNIVDYMDNSFASSFSSIFSNPLKALKNTWSAIISMLALISSFIALLPGTMQGFLYASFALAIVLGLIKIIL